MATSTSLPAIPDEIIMNKIYLYEGINNARQGLGRTIWSGNKEVEGGGTQKCCPFSQGFYVSNDVEEFELWSTQFATSKSDRKGLKHSPFVLPNKVFLCFRVF